jgi:hypothetical protein
MHGKIRLLTLSVQATVFLLLAAAALIVVGVFNESLNWDLFGPKLESILYGVFASCVALAFVGVGLVTVIGTQEIVRAFRTLERHFAGEPEQAEPGRGVYAKILLYGVLAMAVLVVGLAALNQGVQSHRSKVFRKLAAEQMQHFEGKLAALVSPLKAPPRDNVSYELYDLVKTFDDLAFVNGVTLYLPDPQDASAMWGYTAWREYRKEDGCARFFVAKDFERAMQQALAGDVAELDKVNRKPGFSFYHLVKDASGKPIAVLRIDGNERENLREYAFGS